MASQVPEHITIELEKLSDLYLEGSLNYNGLKDLLTLVENLPDVSEAIRKLQALNEFPAHVSQELLKLGSLYANGQIDYEDIKRWVRLLTSLYSEKEVAERNEFAAHVSQELLKLGSLYANGQIDYEDIKRWVRLLTSLYSEKDVAERNEFAAHVSQELLKLGSLYANGQIDYEDIKRWVKLLTSLYSGTHSPEQALAIRQVIDDLSSKSGDTLAAAAAASRDSKFSAGFIAEVLPLRLGQAAAQTIIALAKTSREPGAHSFYQNLDRYQGNVIFSKQSFSQEGEDLILRKIFSKSSGGFYVDVGAYHPVKYSNTYYFYESGWNGINIEPNPDNWNLFELERQRDCNINCAVGVESASYYMYDEAAYNTFRAERVEQLKKTQNIEPVKVLNDIPFRTLASILDEQGVKQIDFMNIDVEGSEIGVLRSNDWDKYSPEVIVVEQTERELQKVTSADVNHFLVERGYELVVMTYSTCFYQRTAR